MGIIVAVMSADHEKMRRNLGTLRRLDPEIAEVRGCGPWFIPFPRTKRARRLRGRAARAKMRFSHGRVLRSADVVPPAGSRSELPGPSLPTPIESRAGARDRGARHGVRAGPERHAVGTCFAVRRRPIAARAAGIAEAVPPSTRPRRSGGISRARCSS